MTQELTANLSPQLHENTITVRLKGGLGNQLFQYATAKALSLNTGLDLLVDTGWFDRKHRPASQLYRLHVFKANPKTVSLSNSELNRLKWKKRLRLERLAKVRYLTDPKDLSYQPINADASGNHFLDGYWQSPRYFDAIRNVLLEELQLAPHVDQSNLVNVAENTVSVHIRRGDYLRGGNTHVVSEQYIHNAMHMFDSDAQFLLFSDDPEWCRKTFTADNITISDEPNDLIALMQMSRCQHNIIANSTFSWWAAWLNQHSKKRVVAPSPWSATGHRHRDILPENWDVIGI